ncbi:hypothetical protein Godav_001147 [Gossypium davidsonii]|uniref:Uncharacterized protein n=1 Tax=Gossypium davidsonii TaxID=34287 RepID=A0A7J8T2V7_GOSDV|nr:hypothetical protein [Gossypium davidsonii]
MVDKDLSDNAGLSAGEIVGEKDNVEVAANSMSFKTRVNKKGVRGFLVDASHGGNVGLGLFMGTVMNDNLDSVALESLGQNFKDFLDKFLGKKPMGLGGFINNNGGSMAKLPASIFSSSASAGSKHACLQNNTPIDDASGQGNLDSRNQANIEVEDLEKIKAHYNLVFDESEGFIVPISDNTLDLGNHFKPSANTRIPLVESMEAMVELLSPQILSKNLNAELDGSCANVKFPRIFREYYMEYKPDIVSLLEPRVSGAKADSIIAKLGFQYSQCVEVIGFFKGIWLG